MPMLQSTHKSAKNQNSLAGNEEAEGTKGYKVAGVMAISKALA
jgi:hypothetical protein